MVGVQRDRSIATAVRGLIGATIVGALEGVGSAGHRARESRAVDPRRNAIRRRRVVVVVMVVAHIPVYTYVYLLYVLISCAGSKRAVELWHQMSCW